MRKRRFGIFFVIFLYILDKINLRGYNIDIN